MWELLFPTTQHMPTRFFGIRHVTPTKTWWNTTNHDSHLLKMLFSFGGFWGQVSDVGTDPAQCLRMMYWVRNSVLWFFNIVSGNYAYYLYYMYTCVFHGENRIIISVRFNSSDLRCQGDVYRSCSFQVTYGDIVVRNNFEENTAFYKIAYLTVYPKNRVRRWRECNMILVVTC